MNLEFRRVERLENGEFVEVPFTELRKGDKFKLYDDGVSNPIEDGSQVYTATSDPRSCTPPGNLVIEIEKVN